MARIRTIKPEFFRHEKLQDLEVCNPGFYPMLVFAGLWTICDKAGRFEWRPRQIKLDILPFIQFEMTDTLGILSKHGFIYKYSVNGKDYGVIPSFPEHQRITGKEAQSPERYPTPPEITEIQLEKQEGNNRETPEKQPRSQERERERERERKGNGGKRVSPKIPLPPDFGISENVRRWAKQKGHYRLEEHLESFVAKCKANGYTYIDWDAAFQEAIRSNWAKIEAGNGNGNGRPKPTSPYHVCSRCGSEYLETDVLEYRGNMICPKCPEAKDMAKESFDRLSTLTKGIGSRAGP